VVVIPQQDAAEVLRLVTDLKSREAQRIEEIADGKIFKSEIDDTLRKKGVI